MCVIGQTGAIKRGCTAPCETGEKAYWKGKTFPIRFKTVFRTAEVTGTWKGARSRMMSKTIKAIHTRISRTGRPCGLAFWGMAALAIAFWGCSQAKEGQDTVEAIVLPPSCVIAVAPALNFSGSLDFDSIKVADLMSSELSETHRIAVIGVSRVLAVLAEQGVDRIQSPAHAVSVCKRLGADGILVFAITEYDAYTPVVGIAGQLYTRSDDAFRGFTSTAPFDGVKPGGMVREIAEQPSAQVQKTFHGEHEDIRNAVKEYADKRTAGKNPAGWKKYLSSQEWFLRFCCFTVARELVRQSAWEFQAQPVMSANAVAQE